MKTKCYTKQNEAEMLMRFSSRKWAEDDNELESFKEDLNRADTTVRNLATLIEGWMASYLIGIGMCEKVEPEWFVEHKQVLLDEFGRETILIILQKVFHFTNMLGYEYVEDRQIMQYVWESYKI